MEISPERFFNWKHDPITIAMFNKFKWFREFKLKEAVSPDIIRAPDSQLIQREYLGCIDTIDLLLSLEFDDLIIPEENKEENLDVNII